MKRLHALLLLIVCLTALCPARVLAQTPQPPFAPLRTDTPPVIDGVLDDPVWSQAPSERGFVTYTPDFGSPMADDTVVWYAYDAENLYFAFRCYDSEPDRIKAAVSARDRIRPDDWVCLNLDTFNDHQSIYALYVNPLGIQMDTKATAVTEDLSTDIVWYSEGRIDEEGYTIEIQVPFKSIRFTYREPVEMGIIFERFVSRRAEAGTYPALDPRVGPNFLLQTRPLIYRDVRHYRLFELLPAFTHSRHSDHAAGTLSETMRTTDLSLTAKYGLTSRLILDGTINPDFSQVEADAGQVDFNQRYALYYPEKRSFFLEGREEFAVGGTQEGDPLGAIVHTRNIVAPSAGLKVTGKLGRDDTVASIYAKDDPAGMAPSDFTILRYRRTLPGDSYLGGFYTGHEREEGSNRVVGVDGLVRVGPSGTVGFHGFRSDTRDTSLVDPSVGHAVGVSYGRLDRDWIVDVRVQDLSTDFETETGFLTRTGVTRYRAGVIKFIYPTSPFLRRVDPVLHAQTSRDHASGIWETMRSFDLRLLFGPNSVLSLGYQGSDEVFAGELFDTGSFRGRIASQFSKRFSVSASYRSGEKIRYILAGPYQGYGEDASAALLYQPGEHVSISLGLTYSDFHRSLDDVEEYDYTILRNHNTWQVNKYLFFRGIVEYNSFYEEMTTDILASFTYIPGTVIHLGYGALYRKVSWDGADYVTAPDLLEVGRGLFFKTSFLWRM